MKAILFNLHDFVLILVLGVSIVMAALSLRIHGARSHKSWFLAATLVLIGMMALDTLIFWGEAVKYAAFNISPWFLTVFSIASFALGPFFYGFIRSELTSVPRLNWRHYLHLLPAFLTPIYLFWACYRFPIDVQHELILALGLYDVPELHFSAFVTLKKFMPLVYGVASLKYFEVQADRPLRSSFEKNHLFLFSLGFTIIWAWVFITHLLGDWLPLRFSDTMGILGNYATLALLISFALSTLRNPRAPLSETSDTSESSSDDTEDVAKWASQIQAFMDREQPYLNSQMTLERFAESLGLPARQVSMVINRGLGQNFQEYINRHRICEAKKLLVDMSLAELTIAQIAKMAGFNSKATFNRHFKYFVSQSPSEYRQRVQTVSSIS